MKELQQQPEELTEIYVDNKLVIALAKSLVTYKRTNISRQDAALFGTSQMEEHEACRNIFEMVSMIIY